MLRRGYDHRDNANLVGVNVIGQGDDLYHGVFGGRLSSRVWALPIRRTWLVVARLAAQVGAVLSNVQAISD